MGNFSTNKCLCMLTHILRGIQRDQLSFILSRNSRDTVLGDVNSCLSCQTQTSSHSRFETDKLGKSHWKEWDAGVPLLWGLLSGVLLC